MPGRVTGSYMITERAYAPYIKEKKEKKIIKGLWKIKGDFLGGPFILHIYHDKKKDETVFIEGFLFCLKEKRNISV